MLHDITPGAEEALKSKMCTAYIGFDPTAPSLTIGNYVQIMLLNLFQRAGHKPIFLLGGATGRIGDPSGKDEERQLKTTEELDINLNFQKAQALKLLNFEHGKNRALMLNNFDFYKDMNVLDFLRDLGKTLTVNYMLSKESVKKRLETGLSFTEFSYQILQAYDFLYLYRHHNCTFQFGGSDQWGNITSGTEFIRRNTKGGKAYAITTPLLTKSDGKKFGKSEAGNIWLDPNLTSPYKFYQFWINSDDADLARFFKFFSFKSRTEIEDLELQYKNDPRTLKKMLAEELTVRIHSKSDFQAVLDVSEILFNKHSAKRSLDSLDKKVFEAMGREIPCHDIMGVGTDMGIDIVALLAEYTDIIKSRGEARRAINNNAISINKVKIADHGHILHRIDLIHDQYFLVENGKKNKVLVRWK